MRDDETGTYWQQISGRAIAGALAGTQLEPVYSDELTFAVWRREEPQGTVLKPVSPYATKYEPKDWEVHVASMPAVINFPKSGVPSRELVLGVAAFGASRAYPVSRVLAEKLVEDHVGTEAVIVVVGPDGKSLRVFRAALPGGAAAPEYYRKTGGAADVAHASLFIDAATGSEWAFDGCAVSGKLAGRCLEPVEALKDYWFDWRNYHPDTTVFRR